MKNAQVENDCGDNHTVTEVRMPMGRALHTNDTLNALNATDSI